MSGNWSKSTCVNSAISFPAKWIHMFLSLGRKAMSLSKVSTFLHGFESLQAMFIGGLFMSKVPYMYESMIGELFSEAVVLVFIIGFRTMSNCPCTKNAKYRSMIGELFTEEVALVQIIGF
ncbi:hypothetical protein ACB094_03G011400 [Castanea mollissima]